MKIALGADHRGHAVKEMISVLLSEMGHDVVDMGANSSRSCDYPDTAWPVSKAVSGSQAARGILVCGSGIGMSIAANKIEGIRAALCHDELTAQMSRRHNDANILCIASDVLGDELIRRIVTSWMESDFESGGRHERRVRKLEMIERGEDPTTYDAENNGLRTEG